jgi:hypothetical protein
MISEHFYYFCYVEHPIKFVGIILKHPVYTLTLILNHAHLHGLTVALKFPLSPAHPQNKWKVNAWYHL